MSTTPFADEVCELFDVRIIHDLCTVGGVDQPCITLGQTAEPHAGLRGFDMTRTFYRVADLEDWCKKYIHVLRAIAEQQEISGCYEIVDCTEPGWE